MTNVEAYKRTIEIMSDLTEDIANSLLTEIAKRSPATLVKAYDKLQKEPEPLAEVKAFIRDGKKIDAIKAYRTIYPSAGLADAKHAVERMM